MVLQSECDEFLSVLQGVLAAAEEGLLLYPSHLSPSSDSLWLSILQPRGTFRTPGNRSHLLQDSPKLVKNGLQRRAGRESAWRCCAAQRAHRSAKTTQLPTILAAETFGVGVAP